MSRSRSSIPKVIVAAGLAALVAVGALGAIADTAHSTSSARTRELVTSALDEFAATLAATPNLPACASAVRGVDHMPDQACTRRGERPVPVLAATRTQMTFVTLSHTGHDSTAEMVSLGVDGAGLVLRRYHVKAGIGLLSAGLGGVQDFQTSPYETIRAAGTTSPSLYAYYDQSGREITPPDAGLSSQATATIRMVRVSLEISAPAGSSATFARAIALNEGATP